MALLRKLASLLPGSRLDVSKRFALLREAISGTMSNFYMARDLRTGKIVGLKIIDKQKIEAIEARYKGLNKPSEGEISIQLKHPNIVETYEYGLTTDGAQYLVQEYLEGPGLNSLIVARSAQLDGQRVNFIRQAAEAIAYLHAAGFLHRDICPRNLLLADNGRTVKLIDFGLTVPARGPFLQPGNRVGNPNYMAPEVVRRRPIDQRIDVFSFGVTAYELCTFELPWPSGATGLAALSHDKPPTDIRTYRPQINPRLAQAIHACIEPDPQRRCPSMESFLQLIRGIKHEDQQ
jgi:serine/threonine protein kinase